MKTTLLLAFSILTFSYCLSAFATETNYPVVIEWERPVTNQVAASQVPALVYRIKQATTVSNVVIVHEVLEKDWPAGKLQMWTAEVDKIHPLSDKGGKIDMSEWGVKAAIFHQLHGAFGSGTFHIALFEARRSGGDTKAETGAQLSNWIELRMGINQ